MLSIDDLGGCGTVASWRPGSVAVHLDAAGASILAFTTFPNAIWLQI